MYRNLILWDSSEKDNLLPFTFTRPIALIRCGILTISEKYGKLLPEFEQSFLTEKYLGYKFPANINEDNLLISGAILPDADFIAAIMKLKIGESLWQKDKLLAARASGEDVLVIKENPDKVELKKIVYKAPIHKLNHIWEIFSLCEQELIKDYQLITAGRKSMEIPEGNVIKNAENIFLEEGAAVNFASLNASAGPIYISADAEIMEGAAVRGAFALGEHSQLKMGAKIYGATVIGPHCKVGGEINNSVFFGYSNKAHDGFIGNSVIGEWCNIGADTNNSNLKNNYEEVKIWNYLKNGFEKTGLQFCGLFMGDHSKCGINTMFNTGTVVGVSANVFGGGFPRNFIPSFSWGGASGFSTYQLGKALDTAVRVMARRNIPLTSDDTSILTYIFDQSHKFRNF